MKLHPRWYHVDFQKTEHAPPDSPCPFTMREGAGSFHAFSDAFAVTEMSSEVSLQHTSGGGGGF